MKLYLMEEKSYTEIFSPFRGEITGLNVKEGTCVETGTPVLEIMRIRDSSAPIPEVIFFVSEQEVSILKTEMMAHLEGAKNGIPPEILIGNITFMSNYPASKSGIQMYFPHEGSTLKLDEKNILKSGLRW